MNDAHILFFFENNIAYALLFNLKFQDNETY